MPRYLIVMESEMNEMKAPSSPRKVGIILGILIALMPQFFAWLLLRKGHTKKARLIGFGWMALWMIISLVLHKPANRDSSASVAPAVAVAPQHRLPVRLKLFLFQPRLQRPNLSLRQLPSPLQNL